MGQYYLLVNLTKRQYVDSMCFSLKMWEILHNIWNKPFLSMVLVDPTNPARSNSKKPRLGSWSGDRLVIIGDYSDGLPPFLTKDEKQELRSRTATNKKRKVAEDEEDNENDKDGDKDGDGDDDEDEGDDEDDEEEDDDEANEGRAPNLYSFAHKHYTRVCFLPQSTDEELAQQFPKGSKTHHLVLNLDRKEYLDPVRFKSPATYAGDFANLQHGVMQGLCSQICYSTGSGGGDVGAFMEGRWAGQRFTIREKDMVEDLESWTDISERVAEDVE
ncbi:hypothetical protein BGX31_008738, partial [Mortierella sp. GBA43]